MFNAQHLSQTVRHSVLQYHEVPAARLQIVTTAGLQLAGIPLEALGTREGKKQVISSCFALSAFAMAVLPPSLGGEADTCNPLQLVGYTEPIGRIHCIHR